MENSSFIPTVAFVKLLGSILLTCAAVSLFSQPAIEWQRTLGGNGFDVAVSTQQTEDGGYIIAGYSESENGDILDNHGLADFWVVKLDNEATVQWKKTFGGSNREWAYCIMQTNDGGYIMAGSASSNDGDLTGNHGLIDWWVVKTNNLGIIEWQKSLGGSLDDFAYSIQQTNDGGYILTGSTYSNDGDISGNHGEFDCWVVKLNEYGEIQWQKTLGGSQDEHAYFIQQTTDGGYIMAGSASSMDGDLSLNYGDRDYWVVKLNNEGSIQWQKILGGTNWDECYSIQQTIDGGFILAGNSYSEDGDISDSKGDRDYWIVKLSNTGNIQWQKSLGGNSSDIAISIRQTIDGGYIIAGYTYSNNGDVTENHGNYDAWIVKIGVQGDLSWQKALGGNESDHGGAINQTSDGGFIFAGASSSIGGDVTENQGKSDFWVIKLSPEFVNTLDQLYQAPQLQIFPNPALQSIFLKAPSETSTMNVIITDMLGRELVRKTIENEVPIDISTLANGLYFVNASTLSGNAFSAKFWKENIPN